MPSAEASIRCIVSMVKGMQQYFHSITEGELPYISCDFLHSQMSLMTSLQARYDLCQNQIIAAQLNEVQRNAEVLAKENFLRQCFILEDCIAEVMDHLPSSCGHPETHQTPLDTRRAILELNRQSHLTIQQSLSLLELEYRLASLSSHASNSAVPMSLNAVCPLDQCQSKNVKSSAPIAMQRQTTPSELPGVPQAIQVTDSAPQIGQSTLDTLNSDLRVSGGKKCKSNTIQDTLSIPMQSSKVTHTSAPHLSLNTVHNLPSSLVTELVGCQEHPATCAHPCCTESLPSCDDYTQTQPELPPKGFQFIKEHDTPVGDLAYTHTPPERGKLFNVSSDCFNDDLLGDASVNLLASFLSPATLPESVAPCATPYLTPGSIEEPLHGDYSSLTRNSTSDIRLNDATSNVRNPDLCFCIPPDAAATSTLPECLDSRDRHKIFSEGKSANDVSANLPAPFSSYAFPAAIAQSSLVSGDPATSSRSRHRFHCAATSASHALLPTSVPLPLTDLAGTPSVNRETLPCHDLSDRASLDPGLSIPTPSDSTSLSSGRFSTPIGSSLSRLSSRAMGHFRTRNFRLQPKTLGALLPWPPDTIAIHHSSCVRPPELLAAMQVQSSSCFSRTPLMPQLSDDAYQRAHSSKTINLDHSRAHGADLGSIVVGEPLPLSQISINACVPAGAHLATDLYIEQQPKKLMMGFIAPESSLETAGNSMLAPSLMMGKAFPGDVSPQSICASPGDDSPQPSCDSPPAGVARQSSHSRIPGLVSHTLISTAVEGHKRHLSLGILSLTTSIMKTMAHSSDIRSCLVNFVNALTQTSSSVPFIAHRIHLLQIVWQDPRPPENEGDWMTARETDSVYNVPATHRWSHLSSSFKEGSTASVQRLHRWIGVRRFKILSYSHLTFLVNHCEISLYS